jgi:hypothetical protein
MFRALFAHFQEVMHKQHLVYCVRVISAGCYQGWSGTNIPIAVYAAPPEDEQVVLKTCTGC